MSEAIGQIELTQVEDEVDVDLSGFFRPAVVAVIGASDDESNPRGRMTKKVWTWTEHWQSRFIPVHPKRNEVWGVRCFRSIGEVDVPVDVAMIMTGNPLEVFREVAAAGVRYAVIFSGGFAEVGPQGAALQDELAELVQASNTRLLGPNTNLNAFDVFRELPGRSIALITQSGHQGRLVAQIQELGIRLSHWAPVGNEVDLEVADFVAYFADQEPVGAIAAYVEGFKNGRSFLRAAYHAAARGVPIVCVKVGSTEAGRSMAASHTGHLVGSDGVVDAVFRQYGVVRTKGLDELHEIAAMFARVSRPTGHGVGLCTISGGTAAQMADLLAEVGIELPEFTSQSQAKLAELIPDYLRTSNPVDTGGPPSMDERGRKILDVIVDDPEVDLLVFAVTGSLPHINLPMARDLVELTDATDTPIFVIWGPPIADGDPAYQLLRESSKLVIFRTMRNCALGIRAYFDYYDFLNRGDWRRPQRLPASEPRVPLPTGRQSLSEAEAKEIIRAYGIACPLEEVVHSEEEAIAAAARIGKSGPLVLKASSADLRHKSEQGLVRLGLRSPGEVGGAYRDLAKHSGGQVLVAKQIQGGIECALGLVHDATFGPTIMFGLGGVFVEVFKDVSFRVVPFSEDETYRMIDETRAAALLRGVRGAKPANIEAIVGAIMKLQQIAIDYSDQISEIDINPLVVDERGAVALDALIVPR